MATEGVLSADNVWTRTWLKTDVGWLATCNPCFWERRSMEGAELTCSHWQVLSASARTRGATELNSRSQIALLGQGYILHITKQISYLIILPSCQWRHGGDSNEQRGGCHSAGLNQ